MQLQAVVTEGMRACLPVQRTSFVDRAREIDRLEELLGTDRCITLTGLGGTGKTRLALEVIARNASRFERVWLVEVAEASSPEDVASRVAQMMVPRPHPEEHPLEAVASMISGRRHLLLLDGCESQLDSCAVIADELLARCASLVILATSREPLSIDGEAVLRVDPLDMRDGAVQLFFDRVEAAAPGMDVGKDLAAVRKLCKRLDGIPLAIELAAPWLGVLTPGELLPRLEDRFALPSLRRGGHDRQRTLRATIDWSYDLLTAPERTLFRRLAVFSGGFTVDAMEAVCGGGAAEESRLLELLLELSRKSLVQVGSHGARLRYRLLETVRQYARERLDKAGESEEIHDRHLAYFLERAESSYEVRMRKGPGADEWRISAESDNLLAALAWARERDPDKGAALAGTLVQELTVLVRVDEARRLIAGVLDRCRPDTATYARALNAEALLTALRHDFDEARNLTDRAVALAEQLRYRDAVGWAEVTRFLVSILSDEPDEARVHVERAVEEFRRSGNRYGYVRTLIRRSTLDVLWRSRIDEEALERALEMGREIGDRTAEGAALSALGFSALLRGDRARAVSLSRRAVELEGEEVQHVYLLRLVGLAAAISRSDPRRAMRLDGAVSSLAGRARLARLPPVLERALAAARADSRRVIGADEADQAWEEGTHMTREEAVEQAMGVQPDQESGPEVPGGLTGRELEVAREVATGRTNREIAEGMHLSVRTIENHVEHALSKLGLNRRTQLATWVHSLRSPGEHGPA
jgi:non-specific serine/threonine protein kinase